ncbi:Crp/Fnr family transcriptional regulator [Chryseobacterium sp. SSA4.19]|uniref:Crp/Fnr family transcriptional regulator n=1 Tax=Chryseobacterium sp. SSA4.19 TaxID=2919915 RepID=UPI001F4E8577|nr:Crp/Fnr family transcriptional regulator [Chryseobacterium sp. SSA4.19]MCJ8154176.1 Crp/Fnr family transcriptional regulator [Chryseobacterium sp. SSA4.19]
MIDEKYLRCHGAVEKKFTAGSCIFSHGTIQNHYYQIIDGIVKLSNTGYDAKDMTFQLLRNREHISLYSVFVEMPSLHHAVALTDCRILVMQKDNFNQMIGRNKVLMLMVLKELSSDFYYQPLKSCCYITDSAENKIEHLFHSLKYDETDQELLSFVIKMSLQQISYIANLSIKTVRSAIENLEDQGLIKIVKGKIFF